MSDDKPKPVYRYTAQDKDIKHPILGCLSFVFITVAFIAVVLCSFFV